MKRVFVFCVLAAAIMAGTAFGRALDQGGDNCASAVTVSSVPFCDLGTTAGYANDYAPNCNPSYAPDVVYRWWPTSTGDYYISLCGSDFDCILHVWDNCPAPETDPIACNDDYCGLQSCMSFYAVAGHDYYIIVDGYQGNSGVYRLNIVPMYMGCPSSLCGWIYDDCEEALPVSIPSTTYASNIGSTDDNVGTGCPAPDGSGVWFSFIAPDSDVVLELRNLTFQAQMWLFCGCCNDFYCQGFTQCGSTEPNSLGFCPEAGMRYLVLVAGCDGEVGTFDFMTYSTGTCSPGTCWGPTELQLDAPGMRTGTTCGRCNNCSARRSEDVVIPVLIPNAGQWVFSLCNSNFDTYLLLGTESCNGDIYARDDTCGVRTTTPCLYLYAGQYFVTIEAYDSMQCGDYELRVNPCPLPAPQDLVVLTSFPDVWLSWSAPSQASIAYYIVYRSTDPNLVVAPENLISTPSETTWLDEGILRHESNRFFYAVTAVAP